MSLLMDALRRAEKARQAQAEKQADGKGTSTSKLSLDPVDVDEPRRDAPPEPPSSPAKDQATTHFSLGDDHPPTERVPPPEAPEEEKLGPFSLVRDNELSLEDTGEMLPVVREAETSLNEYFDDPESSVPTSPVPADTSMDEKSTVAGGRAAREKDKDAKRAAQSVFKAKAPALARDRRNRTLMIALPLFLLGIIGIGVLLFWNDLERTFFGAPPILSPRPPETAQSSPPPEPVIRVASVEPAETAQATQSAAAAEPGAAPDNTSESAEPRGTATGGASESGDDAAAASSGAAAKIAAAAPAAGGSENADRRVFGEVQSTQQPVRSRPPPAAVGRPYAAASAGGIRISRRSDPDRVHAGINEAYLAFQRGDDASAWKFYSRVHRQYPNNRNALLGLGALAVRSGNYAEAVRYYGRLLSINPRDPIARAALINLNQSVPAGEGEGHVKGLLAKYPDQSFFHYTLGNLYARQGRWLEAQRAYFDAYRHDSNSADYAFNLAVSLDRLGQPATAVTYYRRALDLATAGPAKFEPRIARMRVERLAAGGEP